ncbi:MAG: SIS domain-containing protein [Pseudomonadota bacterium]
MTEHIRRALLDAKKALDDLIGDEKKLQVIAGAADMMTEALRNKGRIFSCGNGGSMCDAMHLAEELSGRFRKDRPALAATAISDPSHMSCVANDYGYDQVFSRYVQAHGRAGDVLVAISTSGASPSVIVAATAAASLGMRVVALTGKPGSLLEGKADLCICAPGGPFADRTQELHIKIIHILIEQIERNLYPEIYADCQARSSMNA